MQGLFGQVNRLRPSHWAFIGSLVLSWIAVHFEVTVSKDAAFYLDAAQTFNEQGVAATLAKFNWPWFPILIGVTHSVTGVSLEAIGYLWCALFMAGTCALLVDAVTRRVPGVGGWACLVVLAMPAFNGFRGEILREFGFWFFSTLALWLALRWEERGGWLGGILISAAVAMAALFRLEAILLMGALFLWRLPGLRSAAGLRSMLQLVLMPMLLGGAVLGGLLATDRLPLERAQYYLALLDPRVMFHNFSAIAEQLGSEVLPKYSADDAGKILFFGFLATSVLMFIRLLGPFGVPFLFRDGWRSLRPYLKSFSPFAWAGGLYFIVLMVFYVQQFFINSRYTSFLNLLAVPLAILAMAELARRFPRGIKVLASVAVVVMLANVISLSAKKTHYVEAGHWLAQNLQRSDTIYYEDPRIRYYAGWGYHTPGMSREEAMSDEHVAEFRYYAIEVKADEPWLKPWLDKHGRRILADFKNAKGATVLVIGK
ncbi:hypothetical protein [Metapseudomonas boanensis]|uniref:Glycosyltransferase RgtA/B/C/D-like domain-containing protein n=1 Tax=Metapseudomonas boanensis TaxID=2822138 RepID=A0ABS5XD32_9GAMM|nr:hypothetical protein [Pseudomonas boanensis]MBT8765603.1 hypothetical protein [Pseudomonas boanensis]